LFWLTALAGPGLPRAWAVPGDIAGPGGEPDGFVGIADLNTVLGNWNQTCDPGDWTKGDIDGDGFVGQADLNIVLGHFNQTDPDPFIGTNLAPLAYWNTSWAFVDVMKMARPWLTTDGTTFDTGLTVPTDADGWPTSNPSGQTVFTHVFDQGSGAYPGGDYILTWEGTADITVDWDGVTNPDPGGDPRRKIVTASPTNLGLKINIDNIDTNDPPKNIRLWMPGFENAQSPFHPLFISRLKAFKVLRFMDWQDINGSGDVQWSDRKLSTDAFQNRNSHGIALEYIIQLCNELNADPWFCMPHMADDNYVTQFAQYVKNNLHANATIYVEWSNEIWNTGFGQYNWVKGQAGGKDLGDPAFFQVWAAEAANDFTLWKSVFASDPRTIVRVVAGQKDSVWVTKNVLNKPEMLDPADPTGKEVLFDAVACSTYLSNKTDGYNPNSNSTGVEDILQYTIDRTIPLTDPVSGNPNAKNNTQFYMDHKQWADFYSAQTGRTISFISYEGGQHFVPNDAPAVLKLPINGTGPNIGILLQRNPLMYKAYIDNIAAFKSQGGSLYMAYYSVGKFQDRDTFGHYEFQNESINNAPKHRAVIGGGGR